MTKFYFCCSSSASLEIVAYICIWMFLWQRQSFLPILLIKFLVWPKPKDGLSSDILLSTKLLLILCYFSFVSVSCLFYYFLTLFFIFFSYFSDGSTQNMQFPFWYKSYFFWGLILLLTISSIFPCNSDWGTYPKVLLLLFFFPLITSNIIIFLEEWLTLINRSYRTTKPNFESTSTPTQQQYPIAL